MLESDPGRLRRLQWQVFLAITLGYGFYYVCRLSLNVAKKPLVDAGVLNTEQLGAIGSMLFFAYAAGRLLSGILVDHANVRRFMALGLAASAFIQLVLGSLPGFWTFAVLWGLNGLAQSMGAPASFVTMARWFPVRGRGSVYGLWSTSHNIGEAFTFVVTAALVSHYGAGTGFVAAGCIGLLAALGIQWALRERPEAEGLAPPQDMPATAEKHHNQPAALAALPDSKSSVRAAQKQVLCMPALWVLAAASGSFYVTRYAINSWGVFFLQEAKGYGAVQAASVISAGALAGIAGTFCSGLISDRVFKGGRQAPTLLFGLLHIATLAWFLWGPSSTLSDTAAMALFGVTTGALLAYLGGMIAIDLVPKAAVGMATGMVGVASYLGAGVQDLLSGHFIHASRSVAQGQTHYDFNVVAQWWLGAAVLSCMLAGLVGVLQTVPGNRSPAAPN